MGLSTHDLRLMLGGRYIIDGVSTAFAPGRVTVVLGANGAGKSTLLRALAGLITADGVMLDGAEVATMPARERARAIGFLPQDAVIHWNMQVREVVALGRLPHGGGGAGLIAAALAMTDTATFADRSIRSLSGGERARVLLARVLAGEPRWLLVDEPMASLDPSHQLATIRLLRAAAARGMGVVVVLHDLTLALRLADDAILLKQGKILTQGPAGDVLTGASLSDAYGVRIAVLATAEGPAVLPLDHA